jgi:hypothetical protein
MVMAIVMGTIFWCGNRILVPRLQRQRQRQFLSRQVCYFAPSGYLGWRAGEQWFDVGIAVKGTQLSSPY